MNNYEARAANTFLRWMLNTTQIKRDMYILRIYINNIEKHIIKDNYKKPDKNSEVYIKLKDIVDRCKSYKKQYYMKAEQYTTNEILFLYNVCGGSADIYVDEYCSRKGRLPLNRIQDFYVSSFVDA